VGRHRAPDVVFEFEGSLALARLAWATAGELESLMTDRRRRATETLLRWQGGSATEFGDRIEAEARAVAAIAAELRAEAGAWAIEWTHAIDQENYNRYQDACDQVRADTSIWDWGRDALFGEDDLPPQPAPAATPNAPTFAPTRSFAHY
jgi:hypothetical protein